MWNFTLKSKDIGPNGRWRRCNRPNAALDVPPGEVPMGEDGRPIAVPTAATVGGVGTVPGGLLPNGKGGGRECWCEQPLRVNDSRQEI